MKKVSQIVISVALILATFGIVRAARVIYSQNLVNETALAYNNTYTLNLGASLLSGSNIDSVSFQAIYSSATIAAVTFNDGTASTGTITVSSFSALTGARATNTITVASYSYVNANPVKFTLNGIDFFKDDLWSAGASSQTAVVSICSAINTFAATSATFSCSTTSTGVATLTVISTGAFGNSYTLTSSTQAALKAGTAKFAGGVNNGFLIINGVTLNAGSDWTAATSSAATANSIVTAIQGNTTLNALLTVSTTTPGVVSATSTAVGSSTNYAWFSSSNAALGCSNNQLFGGTNSSLTTASSKITKTNHLFTTALPVLYTKSAGTSPGQLVANTTYYAIPVDANSFKLASNSANAQAGTAVSIGTQTATGGGSFTLTPLAYTGTPSFKWQSSNDNSNWVDLSLSSVTMTSAALASTLWDLGSVNYRYIRLNVVAPTQGGIRLTVLGQGKSNP